KPCCESIRRVRYHTARNRNFTLAILQTTLPDGRSLALHDSSSTCFWVARLTLRITASTIKTRGELPGGNHNYRRLAPLKILNHAWHFPKSGSRVEIWRSSHRAIPSTTLAPRYG